MKHVYLRGAKCLALLLTLAALLALCQSCLFSYQDHNTHRIRGFYEEPENSLDVVFIGASEVFTGFSPGYAYDKYGLTSYMYAMESNQGSLYKAQLKEILKHQSPQVIYVDIFGFLRSVDASLYEEARLRMFVESIPMSKNKLETIFTHPYEDKLSCLFPFIKYHGDLNVARSKLAYAVKRLLAPDVPMSLKGMTTHALIYDGPGDAGSTDASATAISAKCEELLLDFLDFCDQQGLNNVVFVNFPRYLENEENHSLVSCIRIVEDIVQSRGYAMVNLQDRMDEIGIDVTRDFYNTHHLNIYGQQKVTDFFGGLTLRTLGISPMPQRADNAQRWQEAADCTQEAYVLVEQAIRDGKAIWLDELCDEWLFRE